MNVERCNAVIVVFAMHGCPACEEYEPRLEREVKRWQANGWPFVIAERGHTYSRQQIPVIFVNVASSDPSVQQAADNLQISGVPVTVLYRRHQAPRQIEGSIDDRQIYAVLQAATQA